MTDSSTTMAPAGNGVRAPVRRRTPAATRQNSWNASSCGSAK
ncbi:hypothetical protein [Stenotrophomonas maltophilia]|nr:hypothetical protein [Stenotrophomonas maltophilia]